MLTAKHWYASDTTRNAILVSILMLNLVALVATFLYVIGYVVPIYVTTIHQGYLEVAKEHRLAQYENQLQWQSMMQQFFVPISEVEVTPIILPQPNEK